VSGCASRRSNFQVNETESQYGIKVIDAIEKKPGVYDTREYYHPKWITADKIPDICQNKTCIIMDRVAAGMDIRDRNGVHPSIMHDANLKKLNYIPAPLSLNGGVWAHILVPKP
jgi:hypothetical protein